MRGAYKCKVHEADHVKSRQLQTERKYDCGLADKHFRLRNRLIIYHSNLSVVE